MSPQLRTARLTLRRQEPRDAAELIQVAPLRAGETLEARAERLKDSAAISDRWFADYGYGVWVVEEHGSASMVGFVGAKPNDEPGRPELMYGLNERARGKGYAIEAAEALVRHLFSLSATTEVWAQTDPGNVASWRVMERLGMRFEFRGMFKNEDSVVYRLARAQYDAMAGALAQPTPWSLPEIRAALERSAARTAAYFAGLPAERFFTGDARHWGPAHHLGHLILSHTAVARGLRAGDRLPTHPTGISRGSHELGVAALAALAAAPPEWIANNPLTHTPDPGIDAAAMAGLLLEANAAMRAALASWSEAELDARAMPHPTMGPITVREMLLFMALHDRHHVRGVRRSLAAGN